MSANEVATKTGAVSVQNVRKFYQRDSMQIKVLDGLNLEVPPGEFLALMGPSGSGKTIVMVTHDPRAAVRAHTQRHLEKGVLTA